MSGVQGMVMPGQSEQGRRVVKVPPHVRSRELTEEVIRFWARTMRDEEAPYPARVDCSKQIMDRAWGKAPIIVAGDETRPITVDVRTIDSDRLAHLEQALMLALGEGIANVALPSGGIVDYQPDLELPPAGSTKSQPNVNESAPPVDSPFVLDDGAMQHGDGALAPEGLRGGEGDAE